MMRTKKGFGCAMMAFCLLCYGAGPAGGITVISQSADTDITISLPYWDLEFENPLSGNEMVQG